METPKAETPIIVAPISGEGPRYSLLAYLGLAEGPKWKIGCGNCNLAFTARVPLVDNPGVKCPNCGAINVLALETTSP